MRFTIDESVLAKYDIDLTSFLYLWFKARGGEIKSAVAKLIDAKLGYRDYFDAFNIVLGSFNTDKVETILLESEQVIKEKETFFDDLAEELRQLFPEGKKEGTSYMWRSNKAEVAKKLKLLTVKYGFTYTREEAIEATKAYVSSFNGNYKLMRILKYFILKTTKDADGNTSISSDLMEYIENKDKVNPLGDWTNTII